MLDRHSVLNFMDKVTDVVRSASPLATLMGIPFVEKVAGWADTAIDVGKNALEKAEQGAIVLHSTDKEDINLKIAALHEENNKLADYIKNS